LNKKKDKSKGKKGGERGQQTHVAKEEEEE